jgi:hypothetical protein
MHGGAGDKKEQRLSQLDDYWVLVVVEAMRARRARLDV